MKLMVSTTFIEMLKQVPTADDDTEPIIALEEWAIVLTVKSDNPYLDGKQTAAPMRATADIAGHMFQMVISDYEDMHGHPFRLLNTFKYEGVFRGQRVTIELVKVIE
jgi:hypothetical protein